MGSKRERLEDDSQASARIHRWTVVPSLKQDTEQKVWAGRGYMWVYLLSEVLARNLTYKFKKILVYGPNRIEKIPEATDMEKINQGK